MAYFALLWKARTIEKYRLQYEKEKLNSILMSNAQPPKQTLFQRWKLCYENKKNRLLKQSRRWCPEESSLSNFFVYLKTDQTFPNFVLKSVLGFVGGIVLTYLCFMFFIFQLSISLIHATIMSSMIGVLLTLGLAFSYRIRCMVFLLIPQFFSRVGRYTLTCYALVLILTGPATNTLKNSEVLSESMACGQEQIKTNMKQLTDSMEKPFNSMKDMLKLMVGRVKEVANNLKERLLKIERLILSIVRVLQSSFAWLKSVVGICNKKMGTPLERCTKALEDGVADCKAKFGPYFSRLCNIAYVAQPTCTAVRPIRNICVLVEFFNGAIVDYVKKKLKNFSNHIKTMFYVEVFVHHSYTFSSNASRSASQVAAGIVTEIRNRADPMLTWLSWSSCVTSLFLLLIIFRAKHYQHMYETRSRFDNRYVTKELRDLDLKRLRQGRETVLPLNRRERCKYITTTSFRLVPSERVYLTRSVVFIAITTFKLLIHMVADYSLYWVLMTIRYHGRFQSTLHPGVPDAGVLVTGSGPVAAMLRSIVGVLSFPIATPAPSYISCLPNPYPPDLQRYTQIGVLIFLLWFFALFEPYGLRLRHIIMGHYRPERAKARAVWLYNHILRTRGSFMKFARRKLHREYKYSKEEKYTFRYWVDNNIPCCWLKSLLGVSSREPNCLLCSTTENFNDCDTQLIRCETPQCPGIYCASCFSDIGQLCTICLSPIDYGDQSDVSLEKGSSDECSDSGHDSDDNQDPKAQGTIKKRDRFKTPNISKKNHRYNSSKHYKINTNKLPKGPFDEEAQIEIPLCCDCDDEPVTTIILNENYTSAFNKNTSNKNIGICDTRNNATVALSSVKETQMQQNRFPTCDYLFDFENDTLVFNKNTSIKNIQTCDTRNKAMEVDISVKKAQIQQNSFPDRYCSFDFDSKSPLFSEFKHEIKKETKKNVITNTKHKNITLQYSTVQYEKDFKKTIKRNVRKYSKIIQQTKKILRYLKKITLNYYKLEIELTRKIYKSKRDLTEKMSNTTLKLNSRKQKNHTLDTFDENLLINKSEEENNFSSAHAFHNDQMFPNKKLSCNILISRHLPICQKPSKLCKIRKAISSNFNIARSCIFARKIQKNWKKSVKGTKKFRQKKTTLECLAKTFMHLDDEYNEFLCPLKKTRVKTFDNPFYNITLNDKISSNENIKPGMDREKKIEENKDVKNENNEQRKQVELKESKHSCYCMGNVRVYCSKYWNNFKIGVTSNCSEMKTFLRRRDLSLSKKNKNHKRRKKRKSKLKVDRDNSITRKIRKDNEDARNYRISSYLLEQDWIRRQCNENEDHFVTVENFKDEFKHALVKLENKAQSRKIKETKLVAMALTNQCFQTKQNTRLENNDVDKEKISKTLVCKSDMKNIAQKGILTQLFKKFKNEQERSPSLTSKKSDSFMTKCVNFYRLLNIPEKNTEKNTGLGKQISPVTFRFKKVGEIFRQKINIEESSVEIQPPMNYDEMENQNVDNDYQFYDGSGISVYAEKMELSESKTDKNKLEKSSRGFIATIKQTISERFHPLGFRNPLSVIKDFYGNLISVLRSVDNNVEEVMESQHSSVEKAVSRKPVMQSRACQLSEPPNFEVHDRTTQIQRNETDNTSQTEYYKTGCDAGVETVIQTCTCATQYIFKQRTVGTMYHQAVTEIRNPPIQRGGNKSINQKSKSTHIFFPRESKRIQCNNTSQDSTHRSRSEDALIMEKPIDELFDIMSNISNNSESSELQRSCSIKSDTSKTDNTKYSIVTVDYVNETPRRREVNKKIKVKVVTKANRSTATDETKLCDVSTITNDWWSPLVERKNEKKIMLEKKEGGLGIPRNTHERCARKTTGVTTDGRIVSFKSQAQIIPRGTSEDIMSPSRYLLESQRYYNELFTSRFYSPHALPVSPVLKRPEVERDYSVSRNHYPHRSHKTKRLEESYTLQKRISPKMTNYDHMWAMDNKRQNMNSIVFRQNKFNRNTTKLNSATKTKKQPKRRNNRNVQIALQKPEGNLYSCGFASFEDIKLELQCDSTSSY